MSEPRFVVERGEFGFVVRDLQTGERGASTYTHSARDQRTAERAAARRERHPELYGLPPTLKEAQS